MVAIAMQEDQSKYSKAAYRRRGFLSVEELSAQIESLNMQLIALREVHKTMQIARLRGVKIDGRTKFDRALPELDTYAKNLRKAMIDNDV